MLRPTAAVLLFGWAVAGCSPAFNWREVRVDAAGLQAMLPCKPDKGARTVPMAGRPVSLQVLGCDAGGATFAVLFADVGEAGRTAEVLAQWKIATLATMRGTVAQERPFVPPGALGLPQSLQVVATGQRADGSKVQGHAAYFARGTHVFQAVIYYDQLQPEVADVFFSGLKFE